MLSTPYISYRTPPAPDAQHAPIQFVNSIVEEGEIKPAPAATKTRIVRTVTGHSSFSDETNSVNTDTWLEMPGVSHFALTSDDQHDGSLAPSGLALLSAGVAFCYMTQLARYIDNMKLDIEGVRLVQVSPYQVVDGIGTAGPVERTCF